MPANFYYLQRHAHLMAQLAINHGDLTPASYCEECGNPPDGRALDAHHEDYSLPLDVVWLCPVCHNKHKAIRIELEINNRKHHVTPGIAAALNWLQINDPANELSVRGAATRAGLSTGTMGTAKKYLRENGEG